MHLCSWITTPCTQLLKSWLSLTWTIAVALHGATLEVHSEALAGVQSALAGVQSATMRAIFGGLRMAHIILLLCQFHWQSVVQVLVMTIIAPNGISPCYLMNCLLLLGQTCLICAGR